MVIALRAAMNKFHSLRFRLQMTVVLILLAGVSITIISGAMITGRMFANYEEFRWQMNHRHYEKLLEQHFVQGGSWANVQPLVEQMGVVTGKRVILVDTAGKIVADSMAQLTGQPFGASSESPAALIASQGTPVGAVYADSPRWQPGPGREIFLDPLNRTLFLVVIAAAGSIVLFILGLSGRVLAPVETLTAAVRRMEAGELGQRVDITSQDEIGELAQAFNSMANRLAQAETLRRNMVNDIAHELRTPLTNIRGYLEALQDGVVKPERRVVDSLYEEAMLLNRLIDDLQELALAEAGQLRMQRQPTELAAVIHGAVEMFRPQAEANGVTLCADVPDNLARVNIDPERIGQVLRNLVNNALVHTPRGGEIVIAAQPGNEWIAVSVRDTGAGIAPADLPHILERFYRADRSRSRETGGAGLGLAIVKQLVEAHGGQISVKSEIGHGTEFVFTVRTQA
jgi:signal transduction histidine kinase